MKDWEIFPNDLMNPDDLEGNFSLDTTGGGMGAQGPQDGGDPLPPPGTQDPG